MKKSILYLCFVIVALGSFVLMSYTNKKGVNYSPITKEINNIIFYSDQSDGNVTGSPGDGGATCTDCHDAGENFSLVPSITTSIPETGYELNATYTITITTSSSGAAGWGFELTAEKNLDNSIVGTFDVSGVTTGSPQLILSGSSVTHTDDVSSSWSFNWTAPSTNEGAITFYAAVLAASGGAGNNNDQTVTTSFSANSSTLGISEENMLVFEMYPNPSQDLLTILLPNEISTGSIELFDFSGKSMKSKEISTVNNTLDISNLSQGIYFVKLNSEGKIGVQKVIKK